MSKASEKFVKQWLEDNKNLMQELADKVNEAILQGDIITTMLWMKWFKDSSDKIKKVLPPDDDGGDDLKKYVSFNCFTRIGGAYQFSNDF